MIKVKPLLKVCSGSLVSAMNAVEGGALRIELCSALSLDGLTPSIGLIQELRQRYPELLIHVLIRPREGDFVYTEAEVQVMERDIREAVQAGASAIVGGALTADGIIDQATTARLIRAAGDLPFTFHRAFDVITNQGEALEQLIQLGAARVLTSGGASTAEEGIPALRRLVEQSRGRICILPGGGVNSRNARRILDETGVTEIHGSCSVALPSGQRETSAAEVQAILSAIQ